MSDRLSSVIAAIALALSIAALSGCTTVDFGKYQVPQVSDITNGITLQVGEIKDARGFDDPTAIRFNVWFDRPVADAVREALIMELKGAGYSIGESDVIVSGNLTKFSGSEPGVGRCSLSVSVIKGTPPKRIFSKTYQYQNSRKNIFDDAAWLEQIRQCVVQFANDYQLQIALSMSDKERFAQTGRKQVASDVDRLPLSKVQARKNAYAIVIGIEQYRQQIPAADFAAHDAKIVGEYLTKVMGYPEENVVLRLNDKAAKTDMEKYLEEWLPNKVRPGDSVFVYYSGHGAPNLKSGEPYLVPYDGDPAFVESTTYPLKRLYAALNKLPAKEVVVMLDSCFSGAGGRSVIAKGMRPMVLSIENPILASGKTMVLAASNGNQVSSTFDEQGHGLLTYYFLKGIQGDGDLNKDGAIDLAELYEYVRPNVERVARNQFNNEQTPQLLASPEMLRKGGGRLIEARNP